MRALAHARRALVGATFLSTLLAPAAASAQAPEGRAAAVAPAPPQLVVFVTVDQLLPAYFERYADQLTGGLGRLYRGGAVFTNAFQDHAITETAPGHASTMSGRHPRSTGIVANNLGVNEEGAPLVGGGGPGASPFRFRGTVLYDWMRFRDPTARALSLSRKDRGAILPMGRAGREVYWYATDGRMTTSTWYRDTLPAWVQGFNARRLPHGHAGRTWSLLLPEEAYAEEDSIPLEDAGRSFLFPHRLPADTARAVAALPGFPWMDEVLTHFALEGVARMELGARAGHTDLLAMSLSTTDAVGHRWGPDSREIHDQVLRLDRTLGAFVDSLYRLRDSATIAFALTADHGVASYPGLIARRTALPVPFVDVRPVLAANAAALRARNLPPSAMWWDDGVLYVDRPVLRAGGVDPDSAIRAMATALRRVPGVARVDEWRTLAQRDTVRDAIARRWLHMIPPDIDAPLLVSLAPGALYAGTTSATHGTPYDFNAHVPLMFYGPWFVPGRYRQFTSVVDMAPTLARVVGVPPSEALDGRVLLPALVPALRAAPRR